MANLSYLVVLLFLFNLQNVNSNSGQTPDFCKEPPKPGLCMAYFVRWYFDVQNSTCYKFVYGGCQGNENNFDSKELCEAACKISENVESSISQGIAMNSKQEHPEGPCTRHLRRKEAFEYILVHGMPIGPGNYTPSCTEDGYFTPMQCFDGMNKCWCVDRWGVKAKKRSGLRTRGPAHKLQCS